MAEKNERQETRVINAARNMASSAFFQTLLGVFAFIERTVFVHYLGNDYLGLNTLFANILSVLTIAELGIGGTIAYALYKPLAENDTEKIASLMLFYKRAYYIIGSIIIVLGLAITPFLSYFSNAGEGIRNSELCFVIYLLSTGLTYFFSHKHIILEADQKKYLNYSVTCLGSIVQYILQVIFLISTRDYVLYVFVLLVVNVSKSLVLNRIAERKYPILKRKAKHIQRLPEEDRKSITTNIKAMCFHKFGETAVSSSDSILMSYFTSLATLGIYSNYLMIVNTLRSAMRVFYTSILASIGNLCATEERDDIYYSFKSLNFANYLIFSYITVLMFNLLNSVLTLWLGAAYTFGPFTEFLICMTFFLPGIRRMLLNYHDACGLFWADKYKRVYEAVLNLILSIILAIPYGIDGILIGTVASNLLGFWIEGRVVYKYVFFRPARVYVFTYLKECLVTIVMMFLTYAICKAFPIGHILGRLLVNILISVLVPLPLYYLIYRKKSEFQNVMTNIKSYVNLLASRMKRK